MLKLHLIVCFSSDLVDISIFFYFAFVCMYYRRNIGNHILLNIFHARYGQPASEVANDTLLTIGNVIVVNSNLKVIAPKRLVKNTGKALVEGYKTGNVTGSQSNENISHTMITPIPRSFSNSVNGLEEPSTSGFNGNKDTDKIEKKK